MPGSKTFTSTKSHDLFEYNLIRDIEAISNDSINKLCRKIVVEFFKIVFSASITAIITSGTELFLKLNEASGTTDIKDMLIYLVIILGIFLIAYLVLQVLGYIVKSLSNLLLNNRRFMRIKKRDKRKFELYIANTIMSGVSFENKSRHYYKEFSSEISKKAFSEIVKSSHSLDLIMGYIVGCIKAFEKADSDLEKLLPVKMSGYKEKVNKQYVEYIGAGIIYNYIFIAQHTLLRLQDSIIHLNGLDNLKNKEFNCLLDERHSQINILIAHYDTSKGRISRFFSVPENSNDDKNKNEDEELILNN